MKTIILSLSLLASLTSCQRNCSCDPCCPCYIPRNPITAKDAYYHNYYESEPVN